MLFLKQQSRPTSPRKQKARYPPGAKLAVPLAALVATTSATVQLASFWLSVSYDRLRLQTGGETRAPNSSAMYGISPIKRAWSFGGPAGPEGHGHFD